MTRANAPSAPSVEPLAPQPKVILQNEGVVAPSDEPQFDVVWPVGPKHVDRDDLPERLKSLDGVVVAELWDYLFKGDKAFPILRERLRKEFPNITFVEFPVFGNIHGPDEIEVVARLPETLRAHGVDAVICGVGHCGSCTAATIRASFAAEKGGFPTVSILGSLFTGQAKLLSDMFGVEGLPTAVYPGRIPMDDDETFYEKVYGVLADQVIAGLTGAKPRLTQSEAEPKPREVIFRGTLEEVERRFYDNRWTDGLPIVPPTIGRVEAFLRHTDKAPEEVLGVFQPDWRDATVWSVAVIGAMAGCRPEYMPVLTAITEALAEPDFRIADCASGAAWEPLVTVSGPIIKQLDFNYSTGVGRIGRHANSSIGRFQRLLLRNVAGLRPGMTEKGGIGQNFFVAMAEDEDAVREIGWPTLGEEDGVPAGQSGITAQGILAASVPMGEYEYGGDSDNPYTYLRPLVEFFGKGVATYWIHCGITYGGYFPLIVLSPHCARVLGKHRWTKDDVRQYLYDESRMPGRPILGRGLYTGMDLKAAVESGRVSRDFLKSDDPDRLLPTLLNPESTRIIVAGNPDMYWQRGYISNHVHGKPTMKVVRTV